MKITRDSVVPIDFEGLQIVDYTSENGTSSSFAEITIRPGIRHRSGIAGELVYDFCVMGWPFKDGLGGVVSLYGCSGPCGIKSRRAKNDTEK
jgi:hypothetical protein